MSRRQTHRPAIKTARQRIGDVARVTGFYVLAGLIVSMSYSLGSVVRLILAGT